MAGLDIIAAPAPAPDIAFIDATGAPRTLGDYRGKVVLVNLWATWCAPCVQEMPALDRLAAAVAEQDFALLPLSLDIDGTQTVQAFYDKHGIRHLPVLVDKTGRSPAAFGAAGLPFTALIDAEGRLVARHAGDAEWDSAAARAVIDALIGK
ncbi:MAG: TlpA family protein disulfide reductase [Alphaproteobacteria bacterium]|nr:MAG: TlpA family protein disulfide reductase [Alphaproteobacteria bacterium]